MFLLAGTGQQKLGTPPYNTDPVTQEFGKQLLDVQLSRLAIDQRHKVHRERRLQRRVLVQLIQHNIWVCVAAQINMQLYRFFKITEILDPANTFYFVALNQSGNLLDDVVSSLLIGQFRNNNPIPIFLVLFYSALRANNNCAATSVVSPSNSAASTNYAAGRKVRPR